MQIQRLCRNSVALIVVGLQSIVICQIAPLDEFKRKLSELEKIEQLTVPSSEPRGGASDVERLALIRNYYQSQGNAAAKFLIDQLKSIDQDELKFTKNSDDINGAFLYAAELSAKGKSGQTKYDVGYILADMYPNLDKPTRSGVIDSIVKSYTPSTHAKDDLRLMDGMLLRIGKDGFFGFLKLANSNSLFNRCHASDMISVLSRRQTAMIDCHASSKQREESIKSVKAWWNLHNSEYRWPSVPSHFEPLALPPKDN